MTPDLDKLEALAKWAIEKQKVFDGLPNDDASHVAFMLSQIHWSEREKAIEQFRNACGPVEVEFLIARVKELEAALEPFKNKADECAACIATSKCGDSYKVEVDLGDLRNARSIMKGTP
jgi:hypothetical protein